MIELATHDRDRTLSNRFPVPFKMVVEGEAGVTNLGDRDFDFDLLFELDRFSVIATCVNSRKADSLSLDFADDA